jgi:outer membrane protein assembly factor BamB
MPAATGGWAAVGDLEGYLHWIEPETGEIRGRTRATGSEISQRILAAGNVVYVTDIEGELVAVRAPSR